MPLVCKLFLYQICGHRYVNIQIIKKTFKLTMSTCKKIAYRKCKELFKISTKHQISYPHVTSSMLDATYYVNMQLIYFFFFFNLYTITPQKPWAHKHTNSHTHLHILNNKLYVHALSGAYLIGKNLPNPQTPPSPKQKKKKIRKKNKFLACQHIFLAWQLIYVDLREKYVDMREKC